MIEQLGRKLPFFRGLCWLGDSLSLIQRSEIMHKPLLEHADIGKHSTEQENVVLDLWFLWQRIMN